MDKPKISLLKAVLFFLTVFILLSGIQLLTAILITGILPSNKVWLYKWIYLCIDFIPLTAVCICLYKFNKIDIFKELKTSHLSLRIVAFCILLAICWKFIQAPIINLWEIIGGHITIPYIYEPELVKKVVKENQDPLFDARYIERLLYNLLRAVILFPLFEELIFRRYILVGLKNKYSLSLAIIASSILFSMWHFPDLSKLFYTLVSGVMFALILVQTKQILAPVLLHAFGNLFSQSFIRDFGFDYISFMDNIKFSWPYFTIVSFALAIMIFLISQLKPAENSEL